MALWEKVLTLDMMRATVTYDGQYIKHRIKNKRGNCAYVLEDDRVLPILPDSGKLVHILHMQQGFPADISRQMIFEKTGGALDEEQLQMCINEELIKQIEAEAKKTERKQLRGT